MIIPSTEFDAAPESHDITGVYNALVSLCKISTILTSLWTRELSNTEVLTCA